MSEGRPWAHGARGYTGPRRRGDSPFWREKQHRGAGPITVPEDFGVVVRVSRADELTQILNELGSRPGGDSAALIELVYEELRGLSQAYLQNERPDHTLQATALVHEAYLSLSPRTSGWTDRTHFFRAAAKAMRHILINHAQAKGALKRGGGDRPLRLQETSMISADAELDLLVLDDALTRLSAMDPDKGHVVELRFFAGCTIEQTAATLGISTATVERHWRFARAWLRAELQDGEGAGSG